MARAIRRLKWGAISFIVRIQAQPLLRNFATCLLNIKIYGWLQNVDFRVQRLCRQIEHHPGYLRLRFLWPDLHWLLNLLLHGPIHAKANTCANLQVHRAVMALRELLSEVLAQGSFLLSLKIIDLLFL